jgi:hypothetical protein
MPKDFRKKSHDILAAYLERLDRLEKAEFNTLSREWNRLTIVIDVLIRNLLAKGVLSPNQIQQLTDFQTFKDELLMISARYAQFSTAIISRGQGTFGKAGIESAQTMLDLSARFYKKLPVQFVATMVGHTSNGTPLRDILVLRYGENAQRAANILIDSMALGRNPIESARLIGEALDGNVAKSLQIARTEQLFVLRESQTLSYIESGICTGKDWVGEPDACEEICVPGIEGSPYPLDELMDTHPNCILPGQIVAVPNLCGGAKSFYSGIVIEIVTSSGNYLTVTPNHSILTDRGWVIADRLNEGTNVIQHTDPQRMLNRINPNDKQRPAPVEQIFTSLEKTPGMISISMKPTPKDFNGDAIFIKGQINIICPNRHLWNDMESRFRQNIEQGSFVGIQDSFFLNGSGFSFQNGSGYLPAFGSDMGGSNLMDTLIGGHLAPFDRFGLMLISDGDITFNKPTANTTPINTKALRQFVFRNAGFILPDKIVKINRYFYSGHVYDLSSYGYELYTCNNIITHNCRCGWSPRID